MAREAFSYARTEDHPSMTGFRRRLGGAQDRASAKLRELHAQMEGAEATLDVENINYVPLKQDPT